MNETNPPENERPDIEVPETPPVEPETAAWTPEPDALPVAPPPAPGAPGPLPGAPIPAQRLKTNVPFFLLGMFTPIVVMVGVTFVGSLLDNVFSGIIFLAMPVVMLFGAAFLFLAGGRKGNIKLKSFGKGGLWSFAAIPLLALLLFGSCFIGGFPA